MNTTNKLFFSVFTLPKKFNCSIPYLRHNLAFITTISLLICASPIAEAQTILGGSSGGYGASSGMSGGLGSGIRMGGGAGGGGGGGSFTLGYPALNQAGLDQSLFNNNKEMLRNDVDFEDYALRKRVAFAQQMQQNNQADDKLRSYAEQRLKTLTQSKTKLTAGQQAESHDLMDWLKKDAEQRANNVAWLKRQDQLIASLEQDQGLSVQNQRNALHNIYEDNLAVQAQYKWNQQMQLANLHQYQENNGVMYGSHQPFANYGYGGYGNGGGYGGYGFGGRWGY